jgi:hypothetical protein
MSCSPQKTISKIQGKEYKRSFIFKDKNGTAIDLTGSIVKFSMKVSPGDLTHVVSVSLTLTDLTGGKASLILPMTMAV